MGRIKISEAELAALKVRYEAGENIRQICEGYPISPYGLTTNLYKMGCTPRGFAKPKLTPEQLKEISAKNQAGASIRSLSHEYGVAQVTLKSYLAELGGVQDNRSKLTDEQWQEIIAKNQAGALGADLCREYGISQSILCAHFKKHGITLMRLCGTSWKLTSEQKLQAVADYQSGFTIQQVADSYNVQLSSMARVLKRHGVITRKGKLAEEHKTQICELYQTGKTFTEIAPFFGIHYSMVGLVLKERGVSARDAHVAARRYSVNHDYFENADTESKAYWLGFMAADGNVSKNNEVRLRLHECDIDHIRKFKADVNAEHPVKSGVQGLGFASPKMAADLARYGIVPNKSLTYQAWEPPTNLAPHFWRGMIDGDGSIAVGSTPGKCGISLVGSEHAIESFAAFTAPYHASRAKTRKHKSIWEYRLSGAAALSVIRVLYGSATVALDRKMEKAQSVMERTSIVAQ